MLAERLSELLQPYTGPLSNVQLEKLRRYLDVLLRWNARMNLTAIREPEEIVRRHFGESLFLASLLPKATQSVVDVGSGAGFPGIPVKIARPEITLTLIEAQQRKAVFLREALRAMGTDAEVKNVRAEQLTRDKACSVDVVTLRAVEKFESIVRVAAALVRKEAGEVAPGRLVMLIGRNQADIAATELRNWRIEPLIPVPESQNRVILNAEPR